MANHPQTIDELRALVRDSEAVHIESSESSSPPLLPNIASISLSAFNRILEYQPEEYTITVETGVSVKDVQATLAEQGQYLPFDPPFLDANPTIGDTIASGCSGPGAYRYGILRDFIIGLSFIDGYGNRIQAGGKVVKNAAGFDLPKLMVGSGHSLGILTQATFKVFPKPKANRSIEFKSDNLDQGIGRLIALGRSRFTLDALDMDSTGALRIELSGQADALEARISELESFLDSESQATTFDAWPDSIGLKKSPASGFLARVPIAPSSIKRLDQALQERPATRRYSLGGFVSWIHWTASIDAFSTLLGDQSLSGQIASEPSALIGQSNQRPFYDRLKRALDPQNKFPNLYPAAKEVGIPR